MVAERRNLSRRNFSYYMRVMNEMTGESIGHLADISASGFRLDCKMPLQPNATLKMRIEQIGDITNKNFMVFIARARWCKRDEYDVSKYNVGFQLVSISPSDYEIFVKMFNAYGVPKDSNLNSYTTTYA